MGAATRPVRGRPRKLGEVEIGEMRAEWQVRTTAYWAHRFGVGPATIYGMARKYHLPPREKGARNRHGQRRIRQDYVGPKPKFRRCPSCLAIYRKRCPNGH